ncbi:hypothetical protein D5041_04185 [Verminephrobacter aporrectodeae subsp. tuberculatae]|uniref:zonular occludens toxin domain-containing protein n=1 Tax=Verminephrobacter aporrectodeae TaxID=1110389 RepID=UPI002238C064|nr:zonular occludens toxin domain-containing protein [Verminephrobacter aporrectodeae]MCW5222827.1 hypothetical protein [Verminephrobacter aporrectodeae subsp. tuberculatae]MCW5288291.1 hypothetical protein [Verminephrobacter aporrectodeae subsp. tuberculatae]
MLYLVTGANGAGKTLNTLKWVRERSVKENRPVCHNGRFEPIEGGELESWKSIDIKAWQDEPDGTIFLVDECHNDFPVRPPSSAPPEHVRMLAEHRKRGFDFYLVSQHPQNIDSFVRRLIGAPGWHRHLKRAFGADLVSVLEWNAVNPNCEKDGSGKTGTVTMQAFPKEVYGWYRSASLHTGKKRIPKAIWMLGICALLVPTLGYFAFTKVRGNATKPSETSQPSQSGQAVQASQQKRALTADEYVADRVARLKDFPHTAPIYDDVTKPVEAPYPAACVLMGKTCKCYSQQATLLQVSESVCSQIVHQGFFMDWKQAKGEYNVRDRAAPQDQPGQMSAVPVPTPVARRDSPTSTYLQGLAARNAQVRSDLIP